MQPAPWLRTRASPRFFAGDAAMVVGLSLAAAVVASFVPVRRIERIDPAAVFRA